MKLKKSFSLTLADVSAHRPMLYGFAALWILFYHMTSTPSAAILLPVHIFQKIGACGVEIFALLTGFGLYSSLSRNPSIGTFYAKRFSRVFLAGFIVAAIHYGVHPGSIVYFFSRSTFFAYWLGKSTYWYVPFILTMYLVYPAIFAIQKRSGKALWVLFALSLVVSFAASAVDSSWTENCRRAVCRIPVFLLGCIAAPHVLRGDKVSGWVMPASLVAGVALLIAAVNLPHASYYFLRTSSYTFFAVFLILLLPCLSRICIRCGAGRFVYRFMALCGSFSLEIYLLYGRLIKLLECLPAYQAGKISLFRLEIQTVLLTLLCSLLLSRLNQFIIDSFQRTRIPED